MSKQISSILVGLYAWLVSILFGFTFLDRLYADALRDVLGSTNSAMVFSEVSDILLLIYFIVVISAVMAVISIWRSSTARNLFIVSLLALSMELSIPVISAFINISDGLSGLRLLPSGLASVLAFAGLYKNFRRF